MNHGEARAEYLPALFYIKEKRRRLLVCAVGLEGNVVR
jgi:hypothetical protein